MTTFKDVGDLSIFDIALGDLVNDNVPIDAPTFVVKVKRPLGTVPETYSETTYEAGVSPELEHIDEGKYRIRVPYIRSGVWSIRFLVLDVDGTPLGAKEFQRSVRASAFASPLSDLP